MNAEDLDNTVIPMRGKDYPGNVKLGHISYSAQAPITHDEGRTVNRLRSILMRLLRADKVEYAYVSAKKVYDIESDTHIVRVTMTEAVANETA